MVAPFLHILAPGIARQVKVSIDCVHHPISFPPFRSFPNHTGCLLISLSASHSNATYTISDLSALSKQPSYILFSTLYFVSIVLLAFLSFGAVTPSLESFRGFQSSPFVNPSLAIGLLSGCLSGNQTYIKGLSVIVSE